MLYLAFIYHMHQPYYKNLLTQETPQPWVRLHGTKDYLDMLLILQKFPQVRQTFNLVPSLIEQIQDYADHKVKDNFLELSYKPAAELSAQDKNFLLEHFFSIAKDTAISMYPRYYQLYFKKDQHKEFSTQDYLDLQLWFNLAWIDPYFRKEDPRLTEITNKARFFTEEDKCYVLDKQTEILKDIIPTYKKFAESRQVELILSPFYHPILPLLYNTNVAREAHFKSTLPHVNFRYPQDAKAQVDLAMDFFRKSFGAQPKGMWPSEESVSEHILPILIEPGLNWIVADEAILFKSLKKKKRDAALLYQPHILKREEGELNIVFRDRNLSDLLGFEYHRKSPEDAVNDFMKHMENISHAFKNKDILVTVAMDGENAWEYYHNDGWDFLELLYQNLSDCEFLKTTTVNEYLTTHPAKSEIKRLSAGSWIYAHFGKWIGNPYKNKAWEYLAIARKELEHILNSDAREALNGKLPLILKQMYICEGSDWFWWYGEEPAGHFDRLFRMHLSNFYTLINKEIPEYLKKPISP
jgi:alpha-amylase/alpha-mannosidase (GH57 family)